MALEFRCQQSDTDLGPWRRLTWEELSHYRNTCIQFLFTPFSPPQSLYVYRLIPETKGRSLEEMDIIFGSISAEQRQDNIDKRQKELYRTPSNHSIRKVWWVLYIDAELNNQQKIYVEVVVDVFFSRNFQSPSHFVIRIAGIFSASLHWRPTRICLGVTPSSSFSSLQFWIVRIFVSFQKLDIWRRIGDLRGQYIIRSSAFQRTNNLRELATVFSIYWSLRLHDNEKKNTFMNGKSHKYHIGEQLRRSRSCKTRAKSTVVNI